MNQPIQRLIPNQDFVVGVEFVVTDGTAKDMRCNIHAFDLPGKESDELDHAAHKKLNLKFAEDGEAAGTDMVKGGSCMKGVNLRFNQAEISELISGNRTIYLGGHAGWKNDAGADFHDDVCTWMEPPKNDVVVNLGWHQCTP